MDNFRSLTGSEFICQHDLGFYGGTIIDKAALSGYRADLYGANDKNHCCLIDFETIKAAEKQQVAFQEV